MSLTKIRRLTETAIAEPPVQISERTDLQGQHLLLVDDGSPLIDALVEVLRTAGAWVIILQSHPWQRKAPTVPLGDAPEAVEAVVQRIQQVANGLQGVLFVHTTRIPLDQKWWTQTEQRILTAIAVARAISLNSDCPPRFFYFVTAQGGRFALQGDAWTDALATGLEGLVHPLRMEMTKTSFRSIDLDPATSLLEQAQQVVLEIAQPDQPFRTVYGWQKGDRAALSVREIAAASSSLQLTQDAVVVFAGGARGIGAICATALAQKVPCRIIFLGRTALTPEIYALSDLSEAERKVKGDEMMRAYKAEHPGCSPREPRDWWRKYLRAVEAVDTLKQLQALGAVIEYHAVDVRDHSAVTQILRTIRDRYQRLDVVVHVAGLGGVETDRMLSRKEWSVIRSVVETKVAGAINLLQAAEAAQASLFVGFGSIASRFGNSGQVDYAAANALLVGLVRVHNARGVLPVARVIAWGAWDGVGMAVSGPTKDVLQAHGVEFIAPEQGGLSFLGELGPTLSPASPAEVYISPNWAGLDELLQREASLLSPVAADTDVRSLLGEVTQHTPGVSLRAEHCLQAKEISFLDHHRYDGTAWVPAVMGMEVAVEGAARLCPQQQPFALRNIRLKKAVRLVRDEPVLLITEVKVEEERARETQVQATVSAQYKDRTWVFAEMQVILSGDPEVIQQGLDDRHHHHPQTPLALESGELIHWTQEQLYPCEWLRFQTYGSTFQVLQDLHLNFANK
jgi:NAD(P)-dependent dehydrogenase (short-subunit alcohol dehydrogenase family)